MPADTNRLRVDQDGLFTNVEHAVLAKWFRQRKPAAAARIKLDDALAQLGFEEPCDPYSRTAAAVAHVVLEAIEDRLPVWACWKDDKLIKARSYREPDQKPQRRAALLPSELFAINWASSGPGFDWPVQYHLVWTPIYERFVVTASADCPDCFGYADFALGHFCSRRRCRAVRHQDHQARLDDAARRVQPGAMGDADPHRTDQGGRRRIDGRPGVAESMTAKTTSMMTMASRRRSR